MNTIEDLLLKKYQYGIDTNNDWNTYAYNNHPVPRVSDILSTCIHEEFLLGWANHLGFKHKDYKKVREESATKGTYTHNMIEDYLRTGYIETDLSHIDRLYRSGIYYAYNSFLMWYKMMKENCNINILELEKTLITPFVGGTLDGLLDINGKKYIVDFKTSNHMTYKYFIQLAAYQYMIESYYDIDIDGGIFILWLDKNQIRYRDYVLDFSNDYHVDIANQNKETFLSMLYSYFNINKTKYTINELFKDSFV